MAKTEKNTSKTPAKTPAKTDDVSGNPYLETLSTIIWALGIAFVLRTFLFQPFHIPSGSMLPGLMKGDYIITTKYSLGYGEHAAIPLPFPVKNGRLFERKPERGDVLVFRMEEYNKTFIKRLVGLPGDQIEIKDGRLFINGSPVDTKKIGEETYVKKRNNRGSDVEILADVWMETFGDKKAGNEKSHLVYDTLVNGRGDNRSLYTVPAQHYFMMGDNRDDSLDSRFSIVENGAGYVPTEHLMGKAEFVLLSVTDDFQLFKPWTWANMRGDRFFKGIK